MSLLRDLRHVLRRFVRYPGWTALVVLTLAVGIGANTALFTYLCSLLWPTMEAPQPHRMAWFGGSNTPEELDFGFSSVPDWRDYHAQNEVFASLVAGTMFSASVTRGDGAVVHGWGTAVSGEYFALFARAPQLGRWLGPRDDRPGARPAAVLGHLFWQRVFGGDPDVVGRTMRLDGRDRFTVVGVAPPKFQGQGLAASYYIPLAHAGHLLYGLDDREMRRVWGLGRLREGVSFAQARTALSGIARGLDERHPREKARTVVLQPVRAKETSETMAHWVLQGKILMAVVAVFLLLACANVANLLLAQAVARRREIGIRAALGASRWHLARRIGVESALLALAGGAAGIALGWAGTRVLETYFEFMPLGVGDFGEGSTLLIFDHRMAGFAMAAALLTAFVSGLAPLLHAWRQDLVTVLKTEAGGAAPGRRLGPRQLLVVAQVALSVTLLLGAGLLARTFWSLRHIDPGFPTHDLFLATFYVPDAAADAGPEHTAQLAFYRDVVERARTLPGIAAAGLASSVPLAASVALSHVTLPGGETVQVEKIVASSGYLETLGVPLLSGRPLSGRDRTAAAPVALVNQTFAQRWPGGALGRGVTLPAARGEPPRTVEIVGVVRDVRSLGLHEAPPPTLYLPLAQHPRPLMTLALRTAGAVSPAVSLERVLREEHPEVALVEVAPFAEQLRRSLADQRLNADVALAVGVLGLLLATVGLGSLMSYAVSRRGPEIGLRMALGASAGRVVRMVLGEAGRLAAVGVGVGIAAALAFGRVLESLLYGLVGIVDVPTLAAVPLILAGAALIAAYLPARRAARIEPSSALRDE